MKNLTSIGFILCAIALFAGIMANYQLRQEVIELKARVVVLESNPTVKAGKSLESFLDGM